MLVGNMYRQISKCTDKTPKKHYWGGGGGQLPPCPPPPPPSGYASDLDWFWSGPDLDVGAPGHIKLCPPPNIWKRSSWVQKQVKLRNAGSGEYFRPGAPGCLFIWKAPQQLTPYRLKGPGPPPHHKCIAAGLAERLSRLKPPKYGRHKPKSHFPWFLSD